jgi:hypothetical protein
VAKTNPKTDEELEYESLETSLHKLKTDGLTAAVDALIGVCRDDKAPAPAKSSAGTSILRAVGLFDTGRDDGTRKAPSEMTPDELARALDRLKRQLAGGDDAEGQDEELETVGDADKPGKLFE